MTITFFDGSGIAARNDFATLGWKEVFGTLQLAQQLLLAKKAVVYSTSEMHF